MDQVTQQNAAMVEQSTAASRVLAEEAQELARLVARFRVSNGGVQMATHKVAPSHSRPSAAHRPLTRGATALAAAPQVDEESWEEF